MLSLGKLLEMWSSRFGDLRISELGKLEDEIRLDPFSIQLRHELEDNVKPYVGFTLVALLYKGRLVIPKSSSYIPLLLHEYHATLIGVHCHEAKTYLHMAEEWYLVGMRQDVSNYVQKCTVCHQQKVSQQSLTGLLQPLPLLTMVWEDISMDFIE